MTPTKTLILYLLSALLLAGCGQSGKAKNISVAVRSVNYNADRGVTFTLYDVSKEPDPQYRTDGAALRLDGYYPVGGGNLTALAEGGSDCCAELPAQWRPGLKYTVLWQAGSVDISDKNVYRYTAELPHYGKPEDLTVVFYPDHKAEFVVGSAMPGEDDWKGKEKLEPLEACMARNEKKFCYMYLPHYESEADKQAENWRMECRKKLFNGTVNIKTKKDMEELIIFFNNQRNEAKKTGDNAWEKQMLFEIKREQRPNRIGKTYCELWSLDCKEDFEKADSYSKVSQKEMCEIDWRSPDWGE